MNKIVLISGRTGVLELYDTCKKIASEIIR